MAQQSAPAPVAAAGPVAMPTADTQMSTVVVPWSFQVPAIQTGTITSISQLKAQLQAVVQQLDLTPNICKRSADEAYMQQAVRGVLDWGNLKKARTHGNKSYLLGMARDRGVSPSDYSSRNKNRFAKAGGSSGRTYTSRFRGVHQTFPTRRWEAQFRRNGKPTSLGCFDKEDEAARAYDKMMLWCEIHAAGGVKGGVTNFDLAEYEKDIAWLSSVTQDELIESLRCDGRRQAGHRGGTVQPRKPKGTGAGTDPEDSDSGAAIAAALAAAAEATAAVAAAGGSEGMELSRLGLLQIPGEVTAAEELDPAAAAASAAPVGEADDSSAAAMAAAAAGGEGENSAVNAALMGISHEAMAAIQHLQQQLDQAAVAGEAADPQAAAAAAFEIGQIAGSNLLAAVAHPAAAAAAAGTAIAQAAAAAAHNLTPRGTARLLGPSAAGSSNNLAAAAEEAKPSGDAAALHGVAGPDQLTSVPVLTLPAQIQQQLEQQQQPAGDAVDAEGLTVEQGGVQGDLGSSRHV